MHYLPSNPTLTLSPDKLGPRLASRNRGVRDGRMREAKLEACTTRTCQCFTLASPLAIALTEVLSDEVSTLLTNEQRRGIRVRPQVILRLLCQYRFDARTTTEARTGQILRSTHLRFCVP